METKKTKSIKVIALMFIALILLSQYWFVLFLTKQNVPSWLVISSQLLSILTCVLILVHFLESLILRFSPHKE